MPEPPPAQQRKRKAAAEDMEFIVDDEFIESEVYYIRFVAFLIFGTLP